MRTGRLDTPAVARAWLVRGRCSSIDGDPDRAERSYAAAVRVQPGIALPTDDAVFARVQPEGTAPASALTLSASTVVVDPAPGEGGLVAVAVAINDDLALGRTFVLVNADDREVARAPIERAPDATGDAFVRPTHRFSGFPVVDLRARLLDKHGNVLREAPVVVNEAARTALAAAGAPVVVPATATSTWVSLAGAGVAATGFVVGAAGGIAFATAAQADPDRVVDDEGPPLAAFVAGAAMFVVGGVLVVVDQLPR